MSHTTGRCDGRQEGRESGYYHLHRYLNNSIRLHNSQLSTINFQLSARRLATLCLQRTSVALANALISVSQVVVVVRATALVLTTTLVLTVLVLVLATVLVLDVTAVA